MYETYKKAVNGFNKEIDIAEDIAILDYDGLSKYLGDESKNKLFIDRSYPDSPFELCPQKVIEQFRSLALAMIDGEIERLEKMKKGETGDPHLDMWYEEYDQALEDSLSHLRSEREKIANEK